MKCQRQNDELQIISAFCVYWCLCMYKCEYRKTEARFALLLKESLVFIPKYLHFITRTYSFRAAGNIILPSKHSHDRPKTTNRKNKYTFAEIHWPQARPLCDRVTKPELVKSMMAFELN